MKTFFYAFTLSLAMGACTNTNTSSALLGKQAQQQNQQQKQQNDQTADTIVKLLSQSVKALQEVLKQKELGAPIVKYVQDAIQKHSTQPEGLAKDLSQKIKSCDVEKVTEAINFLQDLSRTLSTMAGHPAVSAVAVLNTARIEVFNFSMTVVESAYQDSLTHTGSCANEPFQK